MSWSHKKLRAMQIRHNNIARKISGNAGIRKTINKKQWIAFCSRCTVSNRVTQSHSAGIQPRTVVVVVTSEIETKKKTALQLLFNKTHKQNRHAKTLQHTMQLAQGTIIPIQKFTKIRQSQAIQNKKKLHRHSRQRIKISLLPFKITNSLNSPPTKQMMPWQNKRTKQRKNLSSWLKWKSMLLLRSMIAPSSIL